MANCFPRYRNSCSEVFCKKGAVRNFIKFTGKYLCQSPFFNLVHLFSCEFCKISSTFFDGTTMVAASEGFFGFWHHK